MTQTDRIDGISASVAVKAPCRVATTANITLSGEQTIDGIAVVADDRVLVKDQTTTTENGIYDVSTSAWTRAKDFDGARDAVKGTLCPVNEGTAGTGFIFKVTTANPIVFGTSAIAFAASTFTDLAVSAFWQDVLAETTAVAALTSLGFAKGADIVSASPLVLGTDGNYFDVTAANAITSITVAAGRFFMLQFDSTPTLTHHATNLNLPGGANITAAAGDRLIGFATAANSVHVLSYVRASEALDGAELGFSMVNGTLTASVGASALTVAIKGQDGNDPSASNPVHILFRNATAATGDYSVVTLTAATSLVVSSGSTLATANSTAFRLWLVGFNDGGTFRLGVINCVSSLNIYPLGRNPLASSTAEGGAGGADSAHVFYTGSAVTSKPYAILGTMTWESGLATAGTWSAGPTTIRLFDGHHPLPGQVVQAQRTDDGAVATGTTVIPFDDTVPQNTEGDQYLSQAITPTSAANLLVIDGKVSGALSANATSGFLVALFQDTTANALTADMGALGANAVVGACGILHRMLAGTTGATTFKIRAGPNLAATFTFNGAGGARKLGGVHNSYIDAREVMT